jgi:hypothetical protein
VTHIATNHEGFIEKYVFGFLRSDLVALPLLVRVSFIPFKPGAGI